MGLWYGHCSCLIVGSLRKSAGAGSATGNAGSSPGDAGSSTDNTGSSSDEEEQRYNRLAGSPNSGRGGTIGGCALLFPV